MNESKEQIKAEIYRELAEMLRQGWDEHNTALGMLATLLSKLEDAAKRNQRLEALREVE